MIRFISEFSAQLAADNTWILVSNFIEEEHVVAIAIAISFENRFNALDNKIR